MTIHVYTLRAASEAALIAMLEEAQADKPRPFVFADEEGKRVDAARITFPRPEFADGEPTGMWVCELRLAGPDAVIEALVPD
ncbi:MAG: hypothetical protein C0454_14680 [Parvibaculum sp.]|nr:hypothetical protein [Parvibaculum sp.]